MHPVHDRKIYDFDAGVHCLNLPSLANSSKCLTVLSKYICFSCSLSKITVSCPKYQKLVSSWTRENVEMFATRKKERFFKNWQMTNYMNGTPSSKLPPIKKIKGLKYTMFRASSARTSTRRKYTGIFGHKRVRIFRLKDKLWYLSRVVYTYSSLAIQLDFALGCANNHRHPFTSAKS